MAEKTNIKNGLAVAPGRTQYVAETAHGAYHLAGQPDLYEIQRANNFEFVVDFASNTALNEAVNRLYLTSTFEDVAEAGDTIDLGTASECLRLSVVKSSIPFFKQEVITLDRGNSQIKFAGKPTFNSGTLVINDFIGANPKSILMAWQNLSYNVQTEKVGLAKDYKINCTLIEYTPSYEPVRYWELTGCWISELSEDDSNMEESGKKQVTATIEYDYARPFLYESEQVA